jgi:hypothetical protein
MTRRELFEMFAVVALAPLSLPPDFGHCRWCQGWHDLDVACAAYLEEMEFDIFTNEEGGH